MTAKKTPTAPKPAAAEKAEAEKAAAEKAAAEKAAAEKAAAEKAEAEKDKAKVVTVPALSVASAREGFRRAGRAWSKAATVVRLDELTADQVEQLKNESALTVTEVEIEVPANAE